MALRRADRAERRKRSTNAGGRVATVGVCLCAGLLMVIGAANARGIDLRPARNTDLVSLVQAQAKRNAELTARLTETRTEVEDLSSRRGQQLRSRRGGDPATSSWRG